MARRFGTRNIAPDARQMHVLGRQGSYLTRSALDTWDALNCLHYGKREGVSDHFREATVAATWTWSAAGVFTVPAVVTVEDSLLKVEVASGAQAFLYWNGPITTTCKLASMALVANVVNVRCMIRLDDGSDNNYTEAGIQVASASPTSWQPVRRTRTGGGAVTTVLGSTFYVPAACLPHLHISGTKWTNWTADTYFHTPTGITGLFIAQTASTTGLAFTPTRMGIKCDNAAAGTTQWFVVDWVDLDNDDGWQFP